MRKVVKPKSELTSKTIIINVLMALTALLPTVQEFFVSMGWGTTEVAEVIILVNIALRYATKGPIASRLMAVRQGLRYLIGRKIK